MTEIPGLHALLDRIRQSTQSLEPVALPDDPTPGRPGLADGDRTTWIAWMAERLAELRAPGDADPALIQVADGAAASTALRTLVGDTPRAEVRWPGDPLERRDYLLGITPAVALIAETGSAILDVADHAAAWTSLAVDTHVVCANADAIVPDLVTWYATHAARIADGSLGRFQVQITGASRTADVEKIVVVPAHGPQRLVVLLSDSPVDWASLFSGLSGTP